MPERTIVINRDIQSERRAAAEHRRQEFTRQKTFVVNLVSSPGAGKTTLLEATCRYWKDRWKIAVLVGDLATQRDADRLRPFVPVQQLTTGGACHLELSLVEKGLAKLPQEHFDFLFIENVGNLVCPASHDLAEHLRVVLLSTTEGDDKPGKYPKMFRTSEVMVITKMDLLPHVPFDVDRATVDSHLIRDSMEVITVCSLHDEGIHNWCQMLERRREQLFSEVDVPCST
ncbi:hydrogenase nickel incorporation protein HypB [Aporhodopirellula aestuarii]|uniref:Hydrogenase nickel incorporation protein HypB n=1 Tax=Aporhodopirellula aestuarii TaxID=2950107 RepID=A0ABT0TZ90_9BACT|nr:hydrogenase nickel incorporation protein HypB [Aporhodopirellula aestuarii]MCM2369699.1 hydrogenase nickel incorporation protein HypB [Aporhodopirellula aestuarii]